MAESWQPSGQAGPVAAQRVETAETDGAADAGGTIAALRAHGAERIDPLRFRFIEALARRVQAHQGEARRLLDDRLRRALRECGERCAQAQNAAGKVVADLESKDERTPLADLAAYIAQRSSADAGAPFASPRESHGEAPIDSPAGTSAELKALRYFRTTWSKLSVDRQLTQALAQAPENAGPLNSHLLVLRSLKLMRDLSPDYLNRFMSYADALLWLDRAANAGMPVKR